MVTVIDLKNLAEGVSEKEYTLKAEDFNLDYEEVEVCGDLQVTADLTKSKDQVIFKGEFSVPIKLTCARCAEEFRREIKSDLVFVLKMVPDQSEEISEEGDSDDFFLLPEGTPEFDFRELVREKIILSIEIKPLCEESCKGICPRCGQNLNEKECDCKVDDSDDRWSPLKKFLDRR